MSASSAIPAEVSDVCLECPSEVQEWSRASEESVIISTQNETPQGGATQEEIEENLYDTDLEIEVEKDRFHIRGEDVYLATCKAVGIVPASYFIRHMYDVDLAMKHHGLGPLGAKAISVPLVTNTSVITLDLTDNWLEATGAKYIASMMNENCYITDLDLSDNRLGSEGADYICDVIHGNSILKKLVLSGNCFNDKDAAKFSKAIINNNTLSHLDLSHNEFGIAGGVSLGMAMGENETIEYLDLSWNHIRQRGAMALCEGIKVNPRLKRAFLSWNGLGHEGALAVGEIFKCNDVLLELDISNNRITAQGIAMMSRGVEANETMKIFKIGQNPIGSAGALHLMKVVSDDRNALVELHLNDILVSKEFNAMATKLQETRNIKIVHGGILENFVIKGGKKKLKVFEIGDDEEYRRDPALYVRKFIESNDIRLVDIFAQFDAEQNNQMAAENLNAAFQKAGFKLSEEHMDILINRMNVISGFVDYSVFLN